MPLYVPQTSVLGLFKFKNTDYYKTWQGSPKQWNSMFFIPAHKKRFEVIKGKIQDMLITWSLYTQ